jgi:hypothetical protein
MVVDQTFEGGPWPSGKKSPNLRDLQLLKEVLAIKTMLK